MKRKKNFITFFARADCGCCDIEMKFYSAESAAKAFEEQGMRNGGIIQDDAGETHNGIDTFYGFWTDETENRGLGYLIDKLQQ